MEKLILEAGVRFEEKLQAAKDGQTVNVAAYGGGDRSFNLRAQAQYNPQLQQDKHFMEMVKDVEKYTSPEFIMRGDAGKRLYGLLAGLLKGVLREGISSTDPAQRKINIEKCWNFYKDKKKQLLDWKLDKRSGAADGKGRATDDEDEDANLKEPAPSTHDALTGKFGSVGQKNLGPNPASSIAFTFDMIHSNKLKDRITVPSLNYMQQEEEQQRATGIVKKLQLYKKRNLRKSLQHRLGETISTPDRTTPSASPVASPKTDPGVRIVYRNRAKSDLVASPVFPHSTIFHAATKPEQPKYTKDFETTLHHVHKLWVQRRAQEAEERLEEMEFKDTVSMWSYNQSRIEEEINRRQESFQMSSQTGKACHKILRRPFTAPEFAAELTGSPMKPADSWLGTEDGKTDPGKLPTPSAAGNTLSPIVTKKSVSMAGTVDVDLTTATSSSSVAKPRALPPALGPIQHSLSPYDAVDLTKEESRMRLIKPTPLAAVKTPDRSSDLRMKGFLHTHPNALRSTALLNSPLDVKASQATVYAPSMFAKIGRLPTQNLKEDDEDDPKKKAKPKPKPKGKGGGEAKKSWKKGPVDPQLLDYIVPYPLSIEEEVPSVLRMQQMQQVEAIRESFAKQGLNVPTSVIEQGILTPEDRPYTECITNLPPPDFGLVRDFTKKREKKGKAKKGKK